MRWGQYCGGEAGGWPHRESEPADLWVHYHHIADTRRLLQRNRIADLADQRRQRYQRRRERLQGAAWGRRQPGGSGAVTAAQRAEL